MNGQSLVVEALGFESLDFESELGEESDLGSEGFDSPEPSPEKPFAAPFFFLP